MQYNIIFHLSKGLICNKNLNNSLILSGQLRGLSLFALDAITMLRQASDQTEYVWFIDFFTYSLNDDLLSAYYILGSLLDTRHKNKSDKSNMEKILIFDQLN